MMPTLLGFFGLCLKVGNLTLGGGDPTVMVFQQELVERRRWLTSEQYALLFGLARVTPGTNILAFCAGAGWMLQRLAGAALGVAAVAGPAAFLVVWVTFAYQQWRTNPLAMAAIGGLLAAATGLMAGGSFRLVRPQWNHGRLRALALPAVSFALSYFVRLDPIGILALAVVAGYFWRPSPK